MDPITTAAASGIRARMETLDLLANNLANANTSGYKTDREYYSLYHGAALGGDNLGNITQLPEIDGQWTDFEQGLLESTGSSTDLALKGPGMFVVNGPSGPLYTRNGSFQLNQDGVLVTPEGYPVCLEDGGELRVTSRAPLEVSPDGQIQQSGRKLGRLEVAEFQDQRVLAKQGASYFRTLDPKATPEDASKTEVIQGHLEASNVGAAESAVRLVQVMRQFEMLQRTISMATEMDRKAIRDVASVGP